MYFFPPPCLHLGIPMAKHSGDLNPIDTDLQSRRESKIEKGGDDSVVQADD